MTEANAHDWSERLSAYLDGDLPAAAMVETEHHLHSCDECRQALAELRALVAAAPGYRGTDPERDLWPGIARGIDARRQVALPSAGGPVRRFSLGALLAASVAFAIIGGGLAWLAKGDRAGQPVVATAPELGGGLPATPVTLAPRADSAFDGAVADLEQILAAGRERLDTATVRVIEENLAVIDRAISEARAAIARDPANAWLQRTMTANMRRKIDLLRRASDAIAATQL